MLYTFFVCDLNKDDIEVRVYSAKTFTDRRLAEATARMAANWMGGVGWGVEEVK